MDAVMVDCRALPCPQPVIKTREALAGNPASLEVVVDNLAALENVSRFLDSRGYAASPLEENGLWRIRAHRRDAQTDGAVCEPDASQQPMKLPLPEQMKTLVVISAAVFGNGDDALGGKLMKNFLGTLPEMGSSLWRVILLNGGVTLAVEDSPVLEQLQTLEQNGVDVLVCGACLEHFGLTARRAVGVTTNMLDVVTSMQVAHKVLRV